MRWDELTDRINSYSKGPIKIFMVDHVHPGLFAGYASNPVKTNAPRIDLEPFVAIFNVNNFHMSDHVSGTYIEPGSEPKYHGLIFQGRFTTTRFDEHERQAMSFIRRIIDSGEDPKNLQEYFRLAKELKAY